MAFLKTIVAGATRLLLTLHLIHASNSKKSSSDTLTSNIIQWVRDNDGYVNEKIAFRHVDPDDPSSPRGVFAVQEIDEGETLVNIPWDLVIKSPERTAGKVGGWSEDDCGVIRETINAMTASEDDMTPYGKYLLLQPQNYTVGFWSKKGQDLFVEMTGGTHPKNNVLPPTYIDEQLILEFEETCGGDVTDAMAVQAVMLVRARSDWEYMVPLYDMFNHDNGKYNIQHKYNPYKSSLKETGYGAVASRKIYPGEQLYNSYNRCNICDAYYDWFGTPEIYLHFGFVENYPHRWLFDLARVKFELVQKEEDGSMNINFLVPPSKKGIEMLRQQLVRLTRFSLEYRNKSNDEMGIRSLEWDSLWQYFDALHAALTFVTDTNETLVDDVWKLGDDWWVQEGTTRAEEDEHTVRTTSNDEL